MKESPKGLQIESNYEFTKFVIYKIYKIYISQFFTEAMHPDASTCHTLTSSVVTPALKDSTFCGLRGYELARTAGRGFPAASLPKLKEPPHAEETLNTDAH